MVDDNTIIKNIKGILGASYIGAPQSFTAVYITKKAEKLVESLKNAEKCLVFSEEGVIVPKNILDNHYFYFCKNPQNEYVKYIYRFAEERLLNEKTTPYNVQPGGFWLSETAHIGENVYIGPNSIIGPDVVVGDNTVVLSGVIIKNAIIGSNCLINDNAVVGSNSFTMLKDDNDNLLRIPTLGKVIIKNNVEIGANDTISCGSAGNTVIEDNVKISSLVNIGHDVRIDKNVEITSGVTIGGFAKIGESTFIGLNSTIKNRVSIGKNTIVGMGTIVINDVDDSVTVVGNPSRIVNH